MQLMLFCRYKNKCKKHASGIIPSIGFKPSKRQEGNKMKQILSSDSRRSPIQNSYDNRGGNAVVLLSAALGAGELTFSSLDLSSTAWTYPTLQGGFLSSLIRKLDTKVAALVAKHPLIGCLAAFVGLPCLMLTTLYGSVWLLVTSILSVVACF